MNGLGSDRDELYEQRLLESQPPQTVFRGKEADRVLNEAARERSVRVRLAKSSHIPHTKKKYDLTKENERLVAEALGGEVSESHQDSFDVRVGKHVVEVKTIVAGKNDKVTMHPTSLRSKLQAAKRGGLVAHTIIFDRRNGKEAVYYRKGLGSFRLGAMKKLGHISEAKSLVQPKQKTACVDFDGVLAYHEEGWPITKVGKPLKAGVTLVRNLKAKGYRVVVLTARPKELHSHLGAWLRNNGFQVDAVTNVKPPAEFYIDDRAIRWRKNKN